MAVELNMGLSFFLLLFFQVMGSIFFGLKALMGVWVIKAIWRDSQREKLGVARTFDAQTEPV